MKSKKLLAGVCASLMLAATTIPAVSAADAVKVEVGSAEAKAGENFSVSVKLSDIPSAGINACDFGIEYDKSVITISSVTTGDLAKDDTALAGVEPLEVGLEDGFVSIVYTLTGDNVLSGSGTFLNITGTVNNSAKSGDKSDLKITAIDRNESTTSTTKNGDIIFGNLADDNTTFVNYTPTVTDGLITVIGDDETEPTEETKPTEETPSETVDLTKKTLLGDVDCNGEAAKTADVIMLAKYSANSTKYTITPEGLANADINQDGHVKTEDLSALIEAMLGKLKL